jgi:hypothetical protein
MTSPHRSTLRIAATRRADRARFGVALAAVALTVACARSGSGTGATGASIAPSADRAALGAQLMRRLGALAHDSMEGRGAGTPGGARGRAYIEGELRAMGVAPAGSSYQVPVRVRARPGADSMGANVIARIPGTRGSGPVLVVSAHHDHLGIRNDSIYNGADDDASGSVALLSIAERLQRTPLEHDVIFAWFEAEEGGMLGSRAFVASPPVDVDRIGANLNLDMVSRQDGGALWVTGTAHYPFLRPIAQPPADGAAIPIRFGHDTKGAKPSDDWTTSSDHAPFHRVGIPFLYLGVEDHPDYHKPGDDAAKVDPAFFSASVSFAEQLLRALDAHLDDIHATRRKAP